MVVNTESALTTSRRSVWKAKNKNKNEIGTCWRAALALNFNQNK